MAAAGIGRRRKKMAAPMRPAHNAAERGNPIEDLDRDQRIPPQHRGLVGQFEPMRSHEAADERPEAEFGRVAGVEPGAPCQAQHREVPHQNAGHHQNPEQPKERVPGATRNLEIGEHAQLLAALRRVSNAAAMM